MYTTRSRDGVEISYDIAGEGPPMVLFHPSLSSSATWHHLGYVDALSMDYRLILIDARGHGQSEKPHRELDYRLPRFVDDVVAVLDAEDIYRAHFFGYSLGGRVALGCGAFAQERFASLIVGAGSFERQADGFDRVSYPGALETLARHGVEQFLSEWTSHAGYALPASVETTFRSNDPAAMVPFLRQMDRDHSLESYLPDIEIPALLFAGEHDDYRLLAMREAARLMPRGELKVVSNGTHLSTLFQTDEVLQQVRTFLDKVETPIRKPNQTATP